MQTVLEVLNKTEAFFAQKGVERPRLDAQMLLAHVLGCKRLQLYLQFDRPLDDTQLERARALVRRRAAREPLQYVLGEWDFCGLRLRCDRRALIPRPETEELVEAVWTACPTPPTAALDLGTGTGAIALALAQHWPACAVTATDAAPGALALAAENAAATGLAGRVEFRQGDWFGALPPGAQFDLIVSNPPYLSAAEVAEAAPEVRQWEPMAALAAADDGLAALRTIVADSPARLRPGGLLALETGPGQHPALAEMVRAAGIARWEGREDLRRRPRHFLAWMA